MLQKRAMLANLIVRQWTARKLDRSASAEVDKAHGANDAGRYNKLLIDKSALDPITKLAGALRDRHYELTMPWGDNGDRLLPAALFQKYTGEMRALRGDFDNAVRVFLQNYPLQVQAARNRLGTLYDPADYPDVSVIRTKFSADFGFSPVPEANDFRVEVSAAQAEEIRRNITDTITARQNDAVRHCYTRAAEVVGRIRDRLSKEDQVFRDSLIENAKTLVALLPGLNITQDPMLDELADDIQRHLIVEPTILRNQPDVRARTAQAADDILQRISVFG